MADYRRKRWRDAMAVRVDVNGALSALVGEGGLTPADLDAIAAEIEPIHARLAAERRSHGLRFIELLDDRNDVALVTELADEVKAECETLVVLAIGGSALGAKALYEALRPPFHRARPGSAESGLRVIFAENIDPRTFGAILDEVDPQRTVFNVISKSGETTETIAQFLLVRERLLKTLGALDYKGRVVITTDPDAGELRQIVNDEGFRSLPIPAGVSGHYAMLSAVGLFPAAVAGIDVHEILAGATAMDERCSQPSLFENPAYLHGAVHHWARVEKNKSVQVLMPYSDALAALAEWIQSLWAESLAAERNLDGQQIFSGQTVVRAIGAADQHSQLQLFSEGPNDKIITFFRVEDHGARLEIPEGYSDLPGIAHLGGHMLGDLLNLEQRGTEIALARRGRLTTSIHVPAVNPFTVGQLVLLFQTQTVFAAALARVDPFALAGVDEGKRLTSALAGRKGFEETKAEVQVWMQKKDPRFVI